MSTGELRVCAGDGEPLVWTFEYPGAEYVCGVCGQTDGALGRRAPATIELLIRQDELRVKYETERAVRDARFVPTGPAPVATVDEPGPICSGCGDRPARGTPLVNGKPQAWYSRRNRETSETEYACSRACADGGVLLPW